MDKLSWEERQLSLAKGLLAGNVFDWGAREVVDIMETQDFGFVEAQNKLQGIITVKSVYKGHSREPENVPFIYRLKLYALFINGKNRTALYRQ